MTDPVNDPAVTGSSDTSSTTALRKEVEGARRGGPAIGLGAAPPHPKPVSLVGSYVYSYDLASPGRPSAPAGRSIPSMRPSYDAEHPVSATPIYDSLYSEYRRMFRALPGDRSGEEGLRFTGFAVREQQPREVAPERREQPGYPQHQSFEAYAGQAGGGPQFVPTPGSAAQANGQGWVASGYLGPPQQAAGAPSAAGPAGGRHRSVLSLPPGRDA
ncbi:hypothetical protein [Kitasatospora sp. CB02891]|uniref:hypothetical protein n=1 Tax=Kitasatospora sp. CB02891 TaxID=2020329 RepID=UPI000C27A95A|nr:hypothetical protein [Kitasatospora sp. CB02891]PJN25979.1 hypothetical protein CG736_11270 [Kitasatospora sp. CB02891]